MYLEKIILKQYRYFPYTNNIHHSVLAGHNFFAKYKYC